MRRRYPTGFASLNRMQAVKANPADPLTWPDWCGLPMGAAYTVVSGGGDNRIAPTDDRASDIARLAALATWRLTKGVYWLEPDIQARPHDALWSSPGVPANPRLRPDRYLSGMPQHAVYVAFPPVERPTAAGPLPFPFGVFVHLEHDANSGRPELRLLVDTDGTWGGLTPHPVLLDRPTLMASTRVHAVGALGALASLMKLSGIEKLDAEALTEFANSLPFMVWPAVEAITDAEAEIGQWDLPGIRPEPAQPTAKDGTPVWEPVDMPTRWRVSAAKQRTVLTSV